MDSRLLMATYYPSLLLSNSAYRCQRCGRGTIVASDGFMLTHCLNCGTYHASGEPFDFGAGWLTDKIAAGLKRLREAWKNRKGAQPIGPAPVDAVAAT